MALRPLDAKPLWVERLLCKDEADALVGLGIDYNDLYQQQMLPNFNGSLLNFRHYLKTKYTEMGVQPVHQQRSQNFVVMHYGCVPGSSGANCSCAVSRQRPPARVLRSNFELHSNGPVLVSDTVNDRTASLYELGLVPGHRVQVSYVEPVAIEV